MIAARYRYVAIEGPIAAGKTSLAKRLAERFNADLLLEDPASNPFLPGFYADMRRNALATQLFFFLQRSKQLAEFKLPDAGERPVVADFILEKDPLFAHFTLDGHELRLYDDIYARLRMSPPAPDLVIYLQASVETLVERLNRRGHRDERNVSERYLSDLADRYTRFFHSYQAAPLLIINSDHLNFVDRPADFELLVERIHAMRGTREYFNRAG